MRSRKKPTPNLTPWAVCLVVGLVAGFIARGSNERVIERDVEKIVEVEVIKEVEVVREAPQRLSVNEWLDTIQAEPDREKKLVSLLVLATASHHWTSTAVKALMSATGAEAHLDAKTRLAVALNSQRQMEILKGIAAGLGESFGHSKETQALMRAEQKRLIEWVGGGAK